MPAQYLNKIEARVLAVLMEKELIDPIRIPISPTGLQAACNQTFNRKPVMELSLSDVTEAAESLRKFGLVIEFDASRTVRYGPNVEAALNISNKAAILLATLILKGPATTRKLMENVGEMGSFRNTEEVLFYLDELYRRNERAGETGKRLIAKVFGKNYRKAHWKEQLTGASTIIERPSKGEILQEIGAINERLRNLAEILGVKVGDLADEKTWEQLEDKKEEQRG
jgi:uncharacterized protein YceH (UPF0502 family)